MLLSFFTAASKEWRKSIVRRFVAGFFTKKCLQVHWMAWLSFIVVRLETNRVASSVAVSVHNRHKRDSLLPSTTKRVFTHSSHILWCSVHQFHRRSIINPSTRLRRLDRFLPKFIRTCRWSSFYNRSPRILIAMAAAPAPLEVPETKETWLATLRSRGPWCNSYFDSRNGDISAGAPCRYCVYKLQMHL